MGRPKGSLNKSTIARRQLDTALIHESLSREDGWTNAMAGLGAMQKDKTIHTHIAGFTPLDEETLSQIYMGEGLASRIIDCVADDMTREWIEIENEAAGKTLEAEFMRLGAEQKFNEALKWSRLYGGSVLLIGAMDGQTPDKPLNMKRIRTVEYVKVVSRTDIPIQECIWETNPMSAMYGQIIQYKINLWIRDQQVPVMIHHSRIIPFFNEPIPPRIRPYMLPDERYWGMSSLQTIYESIRDLGGINQSVAHLLYEFLVGKYKVSNLAEMLASGKEHLLVKRMELINMSKSMLNGVILGEDEEYTRDYATLAGLPEVIDRFMLQLSGSTGIPVTRLYGRSPAGLNATGENDLRNYYDLIEAKQRNRLKLPMYRFLEILCAWKKIEQPTFEFNSLYQMTEQEKADYDKTYAEIAQIEANTKRSYIDAGARSADEIRKENGWAEEDIPEEEEEEDEK